MSDTDSITTIEAPLFAYFTGFAASTSTFTYEPSVSAHDNFSRLCRVAGWTKKSVQLADAREGFKDALVQEFNFIYGTDKNDLSAWQNLCQKIGIEPVPETIEECEGFVRNAHVNIVDLIETVNTGGKVRTFANLDELAEYTIKTRRFFPKENAYQGGLLKELLREILNPYWGKRRNGSQRRKRRRARRRAAERASGPTAAAGRTN